MFRSSRRGLSALAALALTLVTVAVLPAPASAVPGQLPTGDPLLTAFTRNNSPIRVVFGADGVGMSGQLPPVCSSTAPVALFTNVERTSTGGDQMTPIYHADYDTRFCTAPGGNRVRVVLAYDRSSGVLTQSDFSGGVMFTWTVDNQEHCIEAEQTFPLTFRTNLDLTEQPLADIVISYPVCYIYGQWVRAQRAPMVQVNKKPEGDAFTYQATATADLAPDPNQTSTNSTRAWADTTFTDPRAGVNSISVGLSVPSGTGGSFGTSWTVQANVVQRQVYVSVDTRGCFVWGWNATSGSDAFESDPNAKICP